MKTITFNSLNVELPPISKAVMSVWIDAIAQRFDKTIGNINYIFTDDEGILDVNRKFLEHDYFTDIITFDYSKRRVISGDIYISIDTVRSNAEKFNVEYICELYRVIIHGILHLCGINDKGPGEREIMEMYENEALEVLTQVFKNG